MGNIFSILSGPLGIAMSWLYGVIQNYGWTIIIFTFLVRIIMFPLTLKQQKSSARMAAYQPMIAEIQKKWANDKNRQNQEVQKFYEENNIKMSVGCLPMVVNMLVLFGIIAVIQAPLGYILSVPEAEINNGMAIVQKLDPEAGIGGSGAAYTQQSALIGEIRENPQQFIDGTEVPAVDGVTYVLQDGQQYKDGQIVDKNGKVVHEKAERHFASMDEEMVRKVQDFKFDFMGLNLAVAPTWNFNRYLIMPIISVLLQIVSQVLIMRATPNPQQSGSQMWIMTILMTVMFGFYAFRVPVGFSLYYATSSVAMTLQQLLLKKVYDPNKIREEVMAEMEERKAAKKAKKKVAVRNDSGDVVTLEMSEAELNKARLQRARELDAKRFAEDAEEEAQAKAAEEKARKLDEEKYGPSAPPSKAKKGKKASEEAAEDVAWTEVDDSEETNEETPEKIEDTVDEKPEENTGKSTEKAKPGRRKKARQNKEKATDKTKEEPSFADAEREAEQADDNEQE